MKTPKKPTKKVAESKRTNNKVTGSATEPKEIKKKSFDDDDDFDTPIDDLDTFDDLDFDDDDDNF